MILLEKQKFLFLKSRKVGGTSFEIALSKFADDKSIVTPIVQEDEEIRRKLGFAGPRNCYDDYPNKNLKYWNHIPAKLAMHKLGSERWQELFKVSIVRNPFDAAISRYFWRVRPNFFSCADFEKFCLSNKNLHTQNHEQYFINGAEIIDFFIRYESIQEDTSKLETLFPELNGLAKLLATIKAKAHYRPPYASVSKMYSQAKAAKELISEICKYEIEKFDYKCI